VTAKKKLPKGVLIGALAGGFLLVALLGYFLLIGPQRSKAADLDKQIDSTQQLITTTRALTAQRKRAPRIRVADLFRITKAMPDQADMAGIVLELNRIAAETGIVFDSITPQPATALTGYQAVPIELVFDGNFYDLSDFLYRLRNLVDVRRGALSATGRLFAIDRLVFDEGDEGFPQLKATITIDAFVFGTETPATSAAEPSAAASAGTTTGSTTTTSAGSTADSPTSSTTTTTTPGSTTPAATTPAPASPPPSDSATAAGAAP
jgi:hypothetical protein